MTWITVKIGIASSVTVVFYRQFDSQENLDQYERDDMISRWISENIEAQRALNGSVSYPLSWGGE